MIENGLTLSALTGLVEGTVFIRGTIENVPTTTLEDVLARERLFPSVEKATLEIHTTIRTPDGTKARLCSADVVYGTLPPYRPTCLVTVRDYLPFADGETVYRDYQALLQRLAADSGAAEAKGWMNNAGIVITGCIGTRTAVVAPSYYPLCEVYETILAELRKLSDQHPDLEVLAHRFAGFMEACKRPYRMVDAVA